MNNENKILEKIDHDDIVKQTLKDMNKMEHYNIKEVKLIYKLCNILEEKYHLIYPDDVAMGYCDAIDSGCKTFDEILKFVDDPSLLTDDDCPILYCNYEGKWRTIQ